MGAVTIDSLLGIEDGLGSVLLVEAADRWPSWVQGDAALGVVDGPGQLEEWIAQRRTAGDLDAVDTVLTALGLVARTESDSAPAVAVLGWLFRRRLRGLARSLAYLAPNDIDHLVGVNFWLAVRQMKDSWRQRVAANLVGAVRRQVLIDVRCGGRQDKTWELTELVDPADLDSADTEDTVSAAAYDLLGLAAQEQVLSPTELGLVVEMLACLADGEQIRDGGRWGGLVSRRAAIDVARRRGVAPATARRHMTGALGALATAYGPGTHRESA